MVTVRTLTRAAIAVGMAASLAVWYACEARPTQSPTGPGATLPAPDFRRAALVQLAHTEALLATPGVIGTAVTRLPDGRAGVLLLLQRSGIAVPEVLDGVPVTTRVTGLLMARSDPTKRARPAPSGYSVGHPLITAGTIGARVRDALGRVYILSNNHVLANSNDATVGDPEFQPGPYDGGTSTDQIGTLSDFQVITFGSSGNNTIDAAIALSDTTLLDNATPSDDGYGMPNSRIYGDTNHDGVFDDENALLGLNVQKYGRTTKLTHGQITGVNATISICYEVSGLLCIKSARYVDQIVIGPSGFSGGGDSGSLIVTDDGNLNPVALLFAGSSTVTIGNRIDLVLARFGVTIDGFAPPPPGPFTDLAVTSVAGPSRAVQGSSNTVTVTVKNFGNQNVTSAFTVTLQDTTEHNTIGPQSVAGLAAGATATLTFPWAPSATGDHVLVGRQSLSDDKAANDQRYVTIPVDAPVTNVAVTSFAGPGSVIVGHGINIGVTVSNVGNMNVASSFVVTLRDSTDHVTLGTQTVNGLAPGAASTLVFSWNTTGATVGTHRIVATSALNDDDPSDNQLTEVVTVTHKPTDIAMTAISAPSSVVKGDTAHVVATLKNVGEVDVTTSFNVVLTDGSAGGVAVATQSVAGLAVGATTTVTLNWNTATADTAGHILIATQKLADDSAGDDAMAVGITVKAPPSAPAADVAVIALNAPTSVAQGSTNNISINLQNVGGQNVATPFILTLTDQTAGTTIGSSTVSSLAAGATTTVSFSWNTTGAALGGHTLVASHNLTDANAGNNSLSAVVQVNPKPTDIAVTAITAPRSVNQGDVAHVVATIQNVGGTDVTSSFNVVLTDGSNGNAVVGTKAVAGLAVGATTTVDIPWTTTGAALGGHIVFATQQLADANSSNNSMGIAITINAPPVLDVAVSGLSAPTSVTQGTTASVTVSVQNVGGLNDTTSFNIVLTDQTAGVTIGTQTLAGLGVSAATSRTFSWNTTGVALGTHTLVASINLADANAANNTRSAAVSVNAPITDLAVTTVNVPSSVTAGTTVTVSVTVQNVGGTNITATFNMVLVDQTTGQTIATQPIGGLAAGASTTRSFSWNTTGLALGSHTLVASQSLADDNAANNSRSATVTLTVPPTDLALASITVAPSSVTQGDTTVVTATVKNVGGVDVTSSFNVVLTDGSAGNAVIGTQTLPGLAVGASANVSFIWGTAGATVGTHIVTATQKLVDATSSNNAMAIGVTVNAPSIHVGNLDGSFTNIDASTWSATVVITAHDWHHTPINGVTVSGTWNGSGPTASCVTGTGGTVGTCSVVLTAIPLATTQVSFAMNNLALTGYVYKNFMNHDPDGSSNGFSITVKRQ
jgi:hypothetical protein